MKSYFFKIACTIAFQCVAFVFFCQTKDSLVTKTIEIKEDVNTTIKRKFNYFISDRFCDDEKLDVFKVIPSTRYPSLIVIRGRFEIIGNPNEKKAKISVYNAANNQLIGVFNTSAYTGSYLMILAPNLQYVFKVEASGYGIIEQTIEIPLKIDFEICQQELKIKLNEKNKPELIINSFFADENEKVTYFKSFVDSTKLSNNDIITELTRQIKTENSQTSTIDDIVKQQLDEEKKKPQEALLAFQKKDFNKAGLLYEDVLKNDPEDPFVNYYYGVSLLNSNNNKAKAINALVKASLVKDVPIDVFLYLGKAYHLSYLFADGIKAFETYRSKEKPYDFEFNNGSLLIKNCINGNNLINEQVNIEVLKRVTTDLENFLSNYNPELVNDNVMLKTDFFYSSKDKNKPDKYYMTHVNAREYYHVSYGEKDSKQLDIFKNNTLPSGTLGNSQNAGLEINTAYDENYPYLTKDGKTLYFSSKGHNSMGGYDIFKCTRKDTLSSWSKPVNLGYPINSTYDDILFVPDESTQTASFCSNRKNGSYEYIHIKQLNKALDNLIIKGFFSTNDSVPNTEAYITVYNSNTSEIAGVYKTNPATGKYLMVLLSDTKYELSVETNNYPEQISTFTLPPKKGDFELKQKITLLTNSGQKSIKLDNYFTEAEALKVTFDVVKKNSSNSNQASAEKEIKIKKPKRNADESAKDKEELALALNLYNQTIYQEAAIVYEHLDAVIDLEPMDYYRYALCLYHTKKDKTTCIKNLELATQTKTIPIDAYYYLAKSGQMSYRFSSAINNYNIYKTLATPEEIKFHNINEEIIHCQHGINLVKNPVILEVHSKKHTDYSNIQNAVTQIESGGKILVISEDMRSSLDKKKNFKSLIFLSADKSTVLFSSYGDNEANGKDIYQVKKVGNKWTPVPLNLSSINSQCDEEFPSLSKDGKTLYFSSKGYENMGGFDIFKSEWDEASNSWSKPINLGSPINSPYDDIYFLE